MHPQALQAAACQLQHQAEAKTPQLQAHALRAHLLGTSAPSLGIGLVAHVWVAVVDGVSLQALEPVPSHLQAGDLHVAAQALPLQARARPRCWQAVRRS